MKTFINAKGLEIFKLDYNGNLWLSGDLHLKPTSTITAGNINAIFAGDISIIRNAVEMDPPYLGNAEVIYYLGETTEKYTNGTWWEKYIKEYICTVDTTSNRDSQFLVYNTVFSVNGEEDTYQYNKSILDLYPTTTKIVLKAIESDGTTPYNRYWEVSYLGKDDLLLFNDCLNSNLLYSTGYNFPLSPLNADDYDEGYSTIIINVEPVYALKEISPIDWSLYMPKAGGEFTGTLHTQNVAPSESDTYILGTEAGRYKAGYFQELYADVLRTKNIEIEELQLDSFALNTSKLEVSSGDGLLITDSEDSNNVKTLDSVKFNKDNKEAFLRQDGVFA